MGRYSFCKCRIPVRYYAQSHLEPMHASARLAGTTGTRATWLILLEDLFGSLLKIPELLPGATVQALVSGTSGPKALATGPAAAVLTAFVLAAFAVATVTVRRDLA